MLNESEKYSILKDKVQSINAHLGNVDKLLKELEIVMKDTLTVNGKIVKDQDYNELKSMITSISNQVSQEILPSIISKIWSERGLFYENIFVFKYQSNYFFIT